VRVFDSLSFPTLILRPDKIVLSANRVFLEESGSELDEIVGRTCHEVLYGSEVGCPSTDCPLTKVLEHRRPQSRLQWMGSKDGEDQWEERVFSPILNDKGQIECIMESLRDVTRLKKLEKHLRETEDLLQKVVMSSPSAIVAAARKGKILFMNRAAELLFGYTFEEALGQSIEHFYPPGMARQIMQKLRDESLGGRGKLPSTPLNILHRSGEEIPVRMTAAIVYEGGRETATMGIFNDLRQRLAVEKQLKEAQAQIAQSEKMASLGQLAAGVAHEINNPLTGILLYANLVRKALAKDNPLQEDLGYVIEDVNRCKDIVRNLLAYSRQTSSAKIIIQLNSLVDSSLQLIRDQKLFANIRLERKMSSEMMLVNVDDNQMSQVIINLVMNACDAMEGSGILTLRTYRDKDARRVFLEVADTGCGIEKENLHKVFDPFFTTKGSGKGTGLGLSTAYGLVQENGGSIRVQETGPMGTTFVVELPMFVPSEEG